MANRKYIVNVPAEQINRFEVFLDVGSMFVYFKYEKIEDGKYVIEGTTDNIGSLIKKYACGLVAITNTVGYSSADIKLKGESIISIAKSSNDEVLLFIDHIKKIYQPEWVFIYLTECDKEEDECI